MDFEFKKGQHVSFTLYTGPSNVEAEAMFKYLNDAHIQNTPIPVNGKGSLIDHVFNVQILHVYRTSWEDMVKGCTVYSVFADGVLTLNK